MRNVLAIIWTWFCVAVLTLVISFGINLLVWGIMLKVLCWALPLFGITAIGGWTIAFSWKLVLVVAIIVAGLRAIFAPSVNVGKG